MRKIAKSVSTVAFPARMLLTADRSPQRSYSGNLHCSPATESHLHLTEARARQHRSRNGGDGRGAFRAIFEMAQKTGSVPRLIESRTLTPARWAALVGATRVSQAPALRWRREVQSRKVRSGDNCGKNLQTLIPVR